MKTGFGAAMRNTQRKSEVGRAISRGSI